MTSEIDMPGCLAILSKIEMSISSGSRIIALFTSQRANRYRQTLTWFYRSNGKGRKGLISPMRYLHVGVWAESFLSLRDSQGSALAPVFSITSEYA